jgi:hypothetical protein
MLDELVSELSSLASAYHKPASTFIGKVRFGADGMRAKQEGIDATDDDITREKALATVVQGQKSENLLDFGDDDETISTSSATYNNGAGALGALAGLDDLVIGGGPSGGLGAGTSGSASFGQPPAAAGGAGLNDLLGLFDAAPGSDEPGAKSGMQALNALSSAAPINGFGSPSPMSPTPASAPATTPKPASGQDDLLGLF